jgi:alkylation response protein AidB-like acyl-CoA dehydrogenase
MTANPFPDAFLAASAKIFCNEMSLRVTSEAVQLHGGYGFTDEYAVSRMYRAARYGSLGGGATETLKDLVGRRLAGAEEADDLLGFDMAIAENSAG